MFNFDFRYLGTHIGSMSSLMRTRHYIHINF